MGLKVWQTDYAKLSTEDQESSHFTPIEPNILQGRTEQSRGRNSSCYKTNGIQYYSAASEAREALTL